MIVVDEVRFRAMGTQCHVIVLDGSADDLDFARDEVERLEQLWSRFRPDSELSQLNRAAGRAFPVSPETMTLVLRAMRAARFTNGWFDPLMGNEIRALGYDRDFAELIGVPAGEGFRTVTLVGTDSGAHLREPQEPVVDHTARTVRLPTGRAFDGGGIGKGLAADLVSAALLARGAAGALVNLGGDLRCRGPEGHRWRISLDDPLHPGESLDDHLGLANGAVATSTPLKRRWRDASGGAHTHLLNPATRRSAEIEVASATVISRSGWIAEALAKTLLLAGPDVAWPLLSSHDSAAIVVLLDGTVLQFD